MINNVLIVVTIFLCLLHFLAGGDIRNPLKSIAYTLRALFFLYVLQLLL